MALGFFVINIMGRSYGVREPNATTLGASFNEVGRRIAGRGSHSLPVVMEADAGSVAFAFRSVAYGRPAENELFFGMAAEQFRDAIYSNQLLWAPDGDEAFDDGSYVLQVESLDQVRLIAFVGKPDVGFDPSSLRDLRLSGDEFSKTGMTDSTTNGNHPFPSCPALKNPLSLAVLEQVRARRGTRAYAYVLFPEHVH